MIYLRAIQMDETEALIWQNDNRIQITDPNPRDL